MGCGTSTTSGQNSAKIDDAANQDLRNANERRRDQNDGWAIQNNDHQRNEINSQHNHGAAAYPNVHAGVDQDLNNPNFFYNEDYLIQQAMQESLLNHNNAQPRNEDEIYNEMVKETLIMSRKEYDDIDRKAKEEEIQRIKDNPELMKKKIETLLANNKLQANNQMANPKKLPPLQMINKNLKPSKNKKQKIDLETVKAPILKQKDMPFLLHKESDGRDGNETDSQIDIKESNKWKKDDTAPSYNPRLLDNQHHVDKVHGHFDSFASSEFNADNSVPKFMNNIREDTNNEDEYQNLINYLDDDDDRVHKNSAQALTHDYNNGTPSKNKLNTKDSFDDLIDGLGIDESPPKPKKGLPGPAKVQVVNNDDKFDDFQF